MLKRERGVRKATGNYRIYSIPGKNAALVPEFAVKTCLRQNCSLGFCACSEGLTLGQNTLMISLMINISYFVINISFHSNYIIYQNAIFLSVPVFGVRIKLNLIRIAYSLFGK